MPVTSVSTIAMAAWPLPDLLAAAGRLRADRVAVGARQLAAHGWPDVEATVRASGVRVGSIGSGLTSPVDTRDSARRELELDLVARSIDLAARLDVPLVTLTTGPAGRLSWEDALDAFTATISPHVRRAADLGVGLTLENTHSLRSDVSFLHSLRDTVAAARHVGTGVCADLYCAWAERGLARTVSDGLDVIRIVQLGDFVHGTMTQPNRWVPGDGDLPLDRLMEEVLSTGYSGVVEIEVLGPRIVDEGVERANARALAWLDARLGCGR